MPHKPQSVIINNARYYQRWTRCNRPNCPQCNRSLPINFAHGPYWWMTTNIQGRRIRRYIGRQLNLDAYRKPDGTLDEEALIDGPRRRPTTSTKPGPRHAPTNHNEQRLADKFALDDAQLSEA